MSDPELVVPEPPRPVDEFVEDMKSLDARRAELTRLYPDRFVVYYKGEVIGEALDLDSLSEPLIDRGMSKVGPVVQFLRTKKIPMRLVRP